MESNRPIKPRASLAQDSVRTPTCPTRRLSRRVQTWVAWEPTRLRRSTAQLRAPRTSCSTPPSSRQTLPCSLSKDRPRTQVPLESLAAASSRMEMGAPRTLTATPWTEETDLDLAMGHSSKELRLTREESCTTPCTERLPDRASQDQSTSRSKTRQESVLEDRFSTSPAMDSPTPFHPPPPRSNFSRQLRSLVMPSRPSTACSRTTL